MRSKTLGQIFKSIDEQSAHFAEKIAQNPKVKAKLTTRLKKLGLK